MAPNPRKFFDCGSVSLCRSLESFENISSPREDIIMLLETQNSTKIYCKMPQLTTRYEVEIGVL